MELEGIRNRTFVSYPRYYLEVFFFSRIVRKITENQPEKPIFRHYSKRVTSEYDPQLHNHTGHIGVCVDVHHSALFCIVNKGLYF